MYENIVVGTDGSERAGVAVSHAAMLASLSGATLHIVHAYRTVMLSEAAVSATSGGGRTVDVQSANASVAAEAQAVCRQAAAHAQSNGVIVETHAVRGDPSDALTDVAQSVGADVVVVGNRGMTGMKRFVLGNVPNKISHRAPCSILIVDTSRAD
jgi:nucleotide-binding universal stress UspA family protein